MSAWRHPKLSMPGTGPRRPPVSPVPGITFHDLRPGDRVRVTISGRTGVILRRCQQKRDGWIVEWDEPMFGVARGRVAWPNLEPEVPLGAGTKEVTE